MGKKDLSEEQNTDQKKEEDLNTQDLLSEIDTFKKQIVEKDNLYKRALADYQNLEKRSYEQRAEWIRSASKQLVQRLLPVLDTLRLANKHIENQGLRLSISQFQDVLQQEGITKIETEGKPFDPTRMECVQTVVGEDGKVLEEVRAGYMLDEKVLRPAQVVVGKKSLEKEENKV